MDIVFKALNFAAKVHTGQSRRKTEPDLPYIIHPAAVALLIQKAGGSEETIAAGLLHDVIEDCKPYGSVTRETLEAEFGADVARMVDDVTEQDKSASWEERKRAAREHIKDMQQDSLLVKSADVYHNTWSMLRAYEKFGPEMFKKFNAPPPAQKEMNQKRIEEIAKAWPANPLLKELQDLQEEFKKIS